MSVKYTQAVRIFVIFGLFLAAPLIAFEQRFGPSATGGGQRSNVQTQQPPTQTPAPATSGQRSQNQGRNESFAWEWWKDDAVKKELRLSDRQVRDISRIYDGRVREMKPISDEFQKQWELQNTMARERTVEVSLFAIQVNRVEALRTELNKTRTVMFYSIYRQLTPEQNALLQKIRDRRRAARGGGGPR